MSRFAPFLAAIILAPMLPAQAPDERVSFVATLGVDTVAVEEITQRDGAIEALVTTRSPRTTLQRHRIVLDHTMHLERLDLEVLDPRTGETVRTTRWQRDGDSLRITPDSGAARAIAAPREVLPFIDLVHWPFELALLRMRIAETNVVVAPMVSGSRVSHFPLAFRGSDSATVQHPSRGIMRVAVTARGGIHTLDAGATTRALVVQRGTGADVAALARDFAERDASGRGMGELSGRGAGEYDVHGVTVALDYGTPRKRGRDIWGALVKYDSLWRTGANRATHVRFSEPLRFGALHVPAGEYTLFTILTATDGTLIINRQTGQNGQQYDAARDLGRVPLLRRTLPEVVETFTILAEPEGASGLLRFMWDDAEYVAPFDVPGG